MKRIITLALLALLAVGSTAPRAHANQGIFATYWNAKDVNDNGYGFGFRSKVPITPFIAFDTRVTYIKFNSDLSIIPIEATGILRLGMLYVGAGVGYYFFDASHVDNNFGWYALGGIDIPAGPVGIFGEVKWTSLSTDVNSGSPLAPGLGVSSKTTLKVDGIGANIGVMFGVPKL